MHLTVLAGVAATAALALGSTAPAMAATTTTTETTVTIHSVPADTAVAIPYDYDAWGDAGSFEPDLSGAITFPIHAGGYDGDSFHHTFATSAEAPEGCVRVVDSFTFGYTLADYGTIDGRSVPLTGGAGTGEPFGFAALDRAGVVHTGNGAVSLVGSGGGVNRVEVQVPALADPQAESGVLTMAYLEPVSPDVARGYIEFGMPTATIWIVDTASFVVTDTCTTEVEVLVPPVEELPIVELPIIEAPAVAPPVVEAPVDAAPAAPLLAETGIDTGHACIAAALLVAAGAGLQLARRRASE